VAGLDPRSTLVDPKGRWPGIQQYPEMIIYGQEIGPPGSGLKREKRSCKGDTLRRVGEIRKEERYYYLGWGVIKEHVWKSTLRRIP